MVFVMAFCVESDYVASIGPIQFGCEHETDNLYHLFPIFCVPVSAWLSVCT